MAKFKKQTEYLEPENKQEILAEEIVTVPVEQPFRFYQDAESLSEWLLSLTTVSTDLTHETLRSVNQTLELVRRVEKKL